MKLPRAKQLENDCFEMLRCSLDETFGFLDTKLPLYSVAGMNADEYEQFVVDNTMHDYCVPVSLCWTCHGDMLVGCAAGQLLKVSLQGTMLFGLSLLRNMLDQLVE